MHPGEWPWAELTQRLKQKLEMNMTQRNRNRKTETYANVDPAKGASGKGGIDPTVEEAYWRDHFKSRPYVTKGDTFADYGPAYRFGWDSYPRYKGRTFDEVKGDLERDWNRVKGESSLNWERAKHATREAWQRMSDAIERAIPGDSDHDGR